MSDITCDDAPATAASEPQERDVRAAWPAVWSLSLGVFGLVTAEFLPASLLTRMAVDLGVSDGAAGQAVTATAVVAGVAGPAIVIGTGRVDRRFVVWGLTILLILSNILAASASSLAVLLIARTTLGVALGGFWALAAALALRLVPPDRMPRAMAIIFTGVSVATVCAAPVGAYVGELWGWRSAFVGAAAIGALALIVQLVTIPRLPSTDLPSLGTLGLVSRRPAIRLGLLVTVLAVAGHFAGFTYVRPFLEQIAELPVAAISGVLLAFGIGGFFGNLAGGYVAERSPALGVASASLLIAATALALVLGGTAPAIAAVAIAAWGFAFGAFPVGIQTWTTRAATDHAESAGALLLTAFQVAIATGAVVGGLLVDGFGPYGVMAFSVVSAGAGGVLMLAGSQRPQRDGRLRSAAAE
jgi:DHA1 family purine ribonucleoside efflux pump-like MFS transporter